MEARLVSSGLLTKSSLQLGYVEHFEIDNVVIEMYQFLNGYQVTQRNYAGHIGSEWTYSTLAGARYHYKNLVRTAIDKNK